MANVVTGATGHIGNVLVRELLARGERVRAIAPAGEDLTPLGGLDLDIVEADMRDVESLKRVINPGDHVYQLAGIVSITRDNPGLINEVNVGGARNIVEACIENKAARLLYTSSIHALVIPPMGTVIDESMPFDPERVDGPYAQTKAKASLEVLVGVERGLDAVIVCPTGVLGPYDFKVSEVGQVLLDAAKNKLRAYIEGAFDWVDVRDVANGMIAAMARGRKGEVYILAGERITIDEILETVDSLCPAKSNRWKVPRGLALAVAELAPLYYRIARSRPRFTKDMVLTVTSNTYISKAKAERELDYTTRPARESIADSIRWFQENGMLACP